MTEYEILLLLDPEAPEERHDEIIARTRELVERDGGRWDSHQPWGRRKLAYEIGHKGEGTYHLLGFTVAPDTLSEVSRILRITDGVMRHLATRRLKGSGRTPPPPPTPFEAPPVPEPEPHAEPVAATAPTDAGAEPEPTATPSDSAEGA
ncbi:MAG: 30S ribosomal protein S6 [Actinobacteria bacterium]|nr:30S ribosomal protein S6 [Actinomycetota bacterium]